MSIEALTVEQIQKELRTLGMLADNELQRAMSEGDDDYTPSYDGQIRRLEAELNRRGLGINGKPFTGIEHFETQWNGERWVCWFRLMQSTFGNAAWGATNMATGQGVGGFTRTLSDANEAIWNHIQATVTETTK